MTELQKARLPLLEAREKNRKGKNLSTLEAKHNKALRRLNRAIYAGIATEKELKASEKMLK